MTLQIGRALGQGVRRAASISGIVVLLSTVLSQLAFLGAMNTLVGNLLPQNARPGGIGPISFTLPLSTNGAVLFSILAFFAGICVSLFAARLLTRDPSVLGSLPIELFTHRFTHAFLSGIGVTLAVAAAIFLCFVVGVLLTLIIPFGIVLPVIPGVFIAVCLQFAIFAVAIEDDGPLGALRRSWGLTRGNRLQLFGLAVLLILLSIIASIVGSIFLLADPFVGQLVSVSANSVFLLALYGVLADAFLQLRDESVYGSDQSQDKRPAGSV